MKLNFILSYVIILTVIINSNAQNDPGTENLTHSWTFNDGTENDYVGGANGTLMGDAYISEGSLFTDLPNSWMEMSGDQILMNAYDEVTIEVWFIPVEAANTGYHMIAYFGNSVNSLGSNGYFITPARGDDKSRAAISCGDEATPWAAESGADGPELDDGQLHHMVSTVNATDITLYIDGVLQQSTPLSDNNNIAFISELFAYLARGGYTADPVWMGEILEFNIFNKALSPEEVLFLFNKGAIPTSVEEGLTMIPKEYNLLQNYPNPFNPETKISFDLPKESMVKIRVYDMLGKEIAALLDEVKPAGRHIIGLDGTRLSSGVYIYRMDVDYQVFSRKMILIK